MIEKHILDIYWPVIEAAKEVKRHYLGQLDGIPKVCPDVTGEMIIKLNEAHKNLPIKRIQ